MNLTRRGGTDRRLAVVEAALGLRNRDERSAAADAPAREAERLVIAAEAEAEFDRLVPERESLARQWSDAFPAFRAAVRALAATAAPLHALAERDGALRELQDAARDRGADRPSPAGRLSAPGDAVELVAAQLREL